MFESERERRRALAQVVVGFIDVVTDGLVEAASEEAASATDHGELRIVAAHEASVIVKSFIASDRMYLATELVPMYQVMGTYLPDYAPGVDYDAMLEVDKRDEAGVFRELDVWKYSPSPLLQRLLVADTQGSSHRSLDYAEHALPLAQVVCALDGRVVEDERYDIKQFEEMLVNEIDKAGVAAARSFDSAVGRWTVTGRNSKQGRVFAIDHPHDPVLDELLSAFFAPRITRKQARLLAESVDRPCGTPGCQDLTRHGEVRCDSCSEFVVAARIDGVWQEIDDVGDGFDVAPADGCAACGAIYLTVESTGVHQRLRCTFCRANYSLRQVRRYLLD